MNVVTAGIVAGSAGTTVLDAVTYLDMTIRGRPASTAPAKTVASIASAFGLAAPGHGSALQARRTGLGALGGIAVGVGIGVAASFLGRAGVRLSVPAGTVGVGIAAMAATDIPIAVCGVSDPRQWSAVDWLSDLIPHLAYGATVTTIVRQRYGDAGRPTAERSGTIRSVVVGVAGGLRSSAGVAAALLAEAPHSRRRARRARRAGAFLLVGGELAADKSPKVPSRLAAPSLTGRLAAGGTGAAMVARQNETDVASAVILGAVGALTGSYAGAWWRHWAGERMPDWQAALMEDAVALTMTVSALRRPART